MDRRGLMRRLGAGLAFGVATALGTGAVQAQTSFPSRPIRLLVGFAPGGPTDGAARTFAKAMEQHLGQTVVVENRPGANSLLAAMELLRSKPDGYTLLLASNGTLTVAPARFAKLPYDVKRDFTLIGPVMTYPHVLVVPSNNPATDFASFVRGAKARSGGLNGASVSHTNDLALEWLHKLTGISISRIPYKGDAAAVGDLVAGRVDMALLAPNVAMPLVEDKKLRAVALTADGGVTSLSQLRSIKDSGLPSFEMEIWNSLVAPAGTPADVVAKIAAALRKAQQSAEVQSSLALSGLHVFGTSTEELARRIDREITQWRTIAREANLPLIEQ